MTINRKTIIDTKDKFKLNGVPGSTTAPAGKEDIRRLAWLLAGGSQCLIRMSELVDFYLGASAPGSAGSVPSIVQTIK